MRAPSESCSHGRVWPVRKAGWAASACPIISASTLRGMTVGAGRRNAMVGDVVPKSELKRWLNDCHSDGFIDKPDAARGLSSQLLRGRPGGRLTVAVGGDARPETAINALLDLLA